MDLPVKYDDIPYNERHLCRKEYIKVQNGLCHYCNAPLDGDPADWAANKKVKPKYYPEGFFKNPIHLHHNHVTGFTIGAVHAHCNAVLWEHHGE